MIESEYIKTVAKKTGFSLCGIARCRPLEERAVFFDSWLSQGKESGMEYMRRNREKRLDPALLVDGAKTIVVCAVNYKNAAWDQTEKRDTPKIASYIYAPDYHKLIKAMLTSLLADIREKYPQVKGRLFSDTAPVLEKAWATEAGMGWTAKNSLLITPEFGSFVLLGELILDTECDCYDIPFTKDGCGTCTLCIENCPTGAIESPRVINTGKCISRMTIEKMPEGVTVQKQMLRGWIAGCDVCQSCCPYNRATPLFSNPLFIPVVDPADTTPEFWENLTEEEFDDIFSDTVLARIGFMTIRSRLTLPSDLTM